MTASTEAATATVIDSATDARLDGFRGLKNSRERARLEAAAGWFVAEGVETVRRILRSETVVRSLFVLPRRTNALAAEASARSVPVLVAEAALYNEVVGFDAHRGVLALCERPVAPHLDHVALAAQRVLAIEGVGDAENLGALFRCAAAFGVDGVVLDPTSADPWSRRSVRVSMGHVVGPPMVRTDHWLPDLQRLKAAGLTLAALTPDGGTELAGWQPPARVALLLGAEGPGLTPATIEAADVQVRIDMAADVDSVNVATAAAVALHHLWAASR